MRAVERTIDRFGQRLLVPEIEIEGWWTTLDLPMKQVIGLYEDHGTSEQFHSEIKSDMDMERLLRVNRHQRSYLDPRWTVLQYLAFHRADRTCRWADPGAIRQTASD